MGRGDKWDEGRRKTGDRRKTGTDTVTRNDHALLSSFRLSMTDITGCRFFPDHQIKLEVSKLVEEKRKEYQVQGGKSQQGGAIGLRISLPERERGTAGVGQSSTQVRTLASDSRNLTS